MVRVTRSSSKAADSKVVKPTVEKAKKITKVVKEKIESTKLNELEVGDEIPKITLLNQEEEELDLLELSKTNKIILIFAYPKASTPGCTRQACGYRDNFNQISKGALILGLSADSPSAQKKFKEKQHFQYDLLSDPKKELISILGAKKLPNGIKRSYWIFKDGKLLVKRIQISPEISIKEGTEKILELIK